MTERTARVYAVLFDLAAGSTEAMGEQIEEEAAGEAVDVSAHVAALFKVAFHLGLRIGLSDVGRGVYDAIEDYAIARAGGMGGMPQDAGLIDEFRAALAGDEPGPVH